MEFFTLGEVLKPQGIKGEVKIKLFTTNEFKLKKGNTVYLNHKPVLITTSRVSGEFAYLSFEGVADRNAAEALRGFTVMGERTKGDVLPEGEYYICDLIGCCVYTDSGQELGELQDILQYGAADVYMVQGKKNFSFPALKRVLKEVDVANKRLVLFEEALAEVAVYEG